MRNYSKSSRPILNSFHSLQRNNKHVGLPTRKYHLQINPQHSNPKLKRRPLHKSIHNPSPISTFQEYRKKVSKYNTIQQNSRLQCPIATEHVQFLQEQLPVISRYRLSKPKDSQLKQYLRTDKGSPERAKVRVNSVRDVRESKKYRIRHRAKKNAVNYKKELQKYLQGEAEARYPKKQLADYLIRKKKEELYNYHNMYFQTYYGHEAEFYRLQTEYPKIIRLQQDHIQQLDHKLLNKYSMPTIPLQQDLEYFITNYEPKNQHIFIKRLLSSPAFIIEIRKDFLFFGEMIDDKKDGIGIQISSNYCFQGIYRDNKKMEGTQIIDDGIYKGQFVEDKRDGNGEFEWSNGEYYIGGWKSGHRHGKGIWTNKQGDSYHGQWLKDTSSGHGHFIMDGRQYKGNFANFQKTGAGLQIFANGDVYEGFFKQNLPHGQGKYTWKDQTVYSGNFTCGLRNGEGKLTRADHFTYEGQFLDERPQGYCIIKMPNSDTYEGFLKNGKKNGRGTLRLYNYYKILDGEWQEDVFICTQR